MDRVVCGIFKATCREAFSRLPHRYRGVAQGGFWGHGLPFARVKNAHVRVREILNVPRHPVQRPFCTLPATAGSAFLLAEVEAGIRVVALVRLGNLAEIVNGSGDLAVRVVAVVARAQRYRECNRAASSYTGNVDAG